MRWIFFLLLAIGFSFSGFSQQDLVPFKKDQLWGYCDREGREVITPQFGEAFPFYNGSALVFKATDKSTGKWGYISPDGKWIDSAPSQISASSKAVNIPPNVSGWVEVYLVSPKGKLVPAYFLVSAQQLTNNREEIIQSSSSRSEPQLKDGFWYYPSTTTSAQIINDKGKSTGLNNEVVGGKFLIQNNGRSIPFPQKARPEKGFVNGYAPILIDPKREDVAGYVYFSSYTNNFIDVEGKLVFPSPKKYVRAFDNGFYWAGNMKDSLTIYGEGMKPIRMFNASCVISANSRGLFIIRSGSNDSLFVYNAIDEKILFRARMQLAGCNYEMKDERFVALKTKSGNLLFDARSFSFFDIGTGDMIDASGRYALILENEKSWIVDTEAHDPREPEKFDKLHIYPEFGVYLWQNDKKSGVRKFTGEEIFSSDCTCVRVLPGGLVFMKLPDGTYAYGDVKTGKIFQVKR